MILKDNFAYFSLTSRKHFSAKVTPSLHLKYGKKWGMPGVGIDKHKVILFLNISIIF